MVELSDFAEKSLKQIYVIFMSNIANFLNLNTRTLRILIKTYVLFETVDSYMNRIYHLFNMTYLRSVLLDYNFKFIPFIMVSQVTKPNVNFACLLYVLSLFGDFANIPKKSLFEQQNCITITKASILGEVEIRIYIGSVLYI